jgi:hypothetical protein
MSLCVVILSRSDSRNKMWILSFYVCVYFIASLLDLYSKFWNIFTILLFVELLCGKNRWTFDFIFLSFIPTHNLWPTRSPYENITKSFGRLIFFSISFAGQKTTLTYIYIYIYRSIIPDGSKSWITVIHMKHVVSKKAFAFLLVLIQIHALCLFNYTFVFLVCCWLRDQQPIRHTKRVQTKAKFWLQSSVTLDLCQNVH